MVTEPVILPEPITSVVAEPAMLPESLRVIVAEPAILPECLRVIVAEPAILPESLRVVVAEPVPSSPARPDTGFSGTPAPGCTADPGRTWSERASDDPDPAPSGTPSPSAVRANLIRDYNKS